MRASVVISAFVAIVVGFGGSVAIILEAARAVGATTEQTSSWVSALCLATAVTTAILSIRHRMPIVAAWSTPGAALIATTQGVSIQAAAGAFFLSAALILLTAAFRPLRSLVERIPTSIASAMLAGVLFGFVIAIFGHIPQSPALVLPLVAAFVLVRVFSPPWAVLAALVLGIVLSYALGLTEPLQDIELSKFVWITPEFSMSTLVGLGIPLYLVTMASQNLPGFAVLKASEYEPPVRSILAVSGAASLLTAGAGAHATNLAAISASICTGEDAHPDKSKRWLCGPFYATGYLALTAIGASVVALFGSFPQALVAAIAGIALAGPFAAAMSSSLTPPDDQFPAVVTFVVTASGLSAFGVGAAFWGLLAGLLVFGINRLLANNAG